MSSTDSCLQVAVLAPVRQLYDYLSTPATCPSALIGCRVRIPFGRGERVGIVVGAQAASHPQAKLKPILALLDDAPLLDTSLLVLASWAADYYCHPIGEALSALLPVELRKGATPRSLNTPAWALTAAGLDALAGHSRIGPRQRELLRRALDQPLSGSDLRAVDFDAARVVAALVQKQWLAPTDLSPPDRGESVREAEFLTLNAGQADALGTILARRATYAAFLLQGVTGSGKTEVYLQAAREFLAKGRQVLVLIPEIGLSEQLVQRFEERFGKAVAVLHSELSERDRSLVWERARRDEVGIVLGTRSAVWVPLPALGLIVVDEEHDASFKQQDGFRYSARDVAVVRARNSEIPIILGSATPSLESEMNARKGRYQRLLLPSRAGGAVAPQLHGIDVRGLPLSGGLSAPLCAAIESHLARGEQALLFLNRRGYAPLLMCHLCGWIAQCERCDARLVLHQGREKLVCHHCGAERRVHDERLKCCATPDLITLGVGTEQVEEALRTRFPARRILRIDRDSMRRKGQLESAYAAVRERQVDILIGTQLLAKGHDFPGVTLVGIVDADSRLFATDFRAGERFAQMLLQVAGRAGRAAAPGAVLVQTHHPSHPLLQLVLRHDYAEFAEAALREREAAALPPYVAMTVIRAEAIDQGAPLRFLRDVRHAIEALIGPEVELSGPVPAPMERKAGKYRAVLMLTALRRASLAHALRMTVRAIATLPTRHRVRWHIDVDPQDAG